MCPHCGQIYSPSKISLDSSKTGGEEDEENASNQSSITSQNENGGNPKYPSLISGLKDVQLLMDSSPTPDSVDKCTVSNGIDDS